MPRHPLPDTQLIARLRARDTQAIEAVVKAEAPVLWRAARAAGLSEPDAEDVVQETLLVFVRRVDEFDGSAAVGTWLYGILLNKIREFRRSDKREDMVADIEAVLDARFDASGRWIRPPPLPDAEVALSQVAEWLRDCLSDLPERYRFAFLLKEAEARTTGEICKILSVTANNLGVILFRARVALRECLEAKGIRRSSDATL